MVLLTLVALVIGCAVRATPGTTTGGTTCTVTAKGMAFDTAMIAVPAGAHLTITFRNNDEGVSHNIPFHTSSAAATVICKGARITGVSSIPYTLDAPPATPGTSSAVTSIQP